MYGFNKEYALPDPKTDWLYSLGIQDLYKGLLKSLSFKAKKKSSIPIEQFAVIVGFLKSIAETAI
jgi:hypothetical protein